MTTLNPVTASIETDRNLLKPLRGTHELNTGVRFIQSSPYSEKPHLLDLDSLDYEYRILALALQVFNSKTQDYAIENYESSFNIGEVIDLAHQLANQFGKSLSQFEVYVIAFRSKLKPEIQKSSENRRILGDVDRLSHAEANKSGGLLKYWFGIPNVDAHNLATCWWRERQDARSGGGGSGHREGVNLVRNWYEVWIIEEYKITLKDSSYDFEKLS